MWRWLGARFASESGANAVEFGLLAPIVFAILLGGIYGGWAWNNQQTLTHAAREDHHGDVGREAR
jgi:Flp pilus assembly protein TadG